MRKIFTGALVLFALLPGCSRAPKIVNLDSKGTNIICFGDSLTEGYGAEPGQDYPSVLAGCLGRKVINAGVSGNTSADALQRIEKDVLSQDPKLVIVELGGNDFLQKLPVEETLRNVGEIVDRIQRAGAAVALLEVRTALWNDQYLKGFRELAREKRALLIPDILSGIMGRPDLMSDTIHPNARGYAIMADRVCRELKPYLQ